MLKLGDITFKPYLDEKTIQEAISAIASKINNEYNGNDNIPIILATLAGALFFAADLLRKLEFYPKIGFVKASSYGSGTKSSGKVEIKMEPTVNVAGEDVIVLEDIIDSGLTWKYLKQYLLDKGAKRVRIATLLEKDNKENIHADWAGIKVDNSFVVGMGLDYAEKGRNLPIIYKAT